MIIKTFESFNDEEYYTQISDVEYESLKKTIINIDRSVITRIKNNTKIKLDCIGLIGPNIYQKNTKNTNLGIYISYNIEQLEREYNMYIYELKDEWFIISSYQLYTLGNTYYKCDQVSGLMKLLNNLGIVNE